ncbi:organic cation transporter protein-like [Microplitis mediator]|uniref:organic cation transporter protein-like n=1 Tax=Microplitis mediator TaxID=375433 RepID=UPI0025568D07|nr:organic cation transporter protein-like [Microplitis mediator]
MENEKNQEKCLVRTLDELGRSSKLLWVVFIVSALASLTNGLHSMSYVFIAEVPIYRCSIPELKNANWTDEQIKNISIIDDCQKYDYNYTYLASLRHEEAIEYVKDIEFNTSVVSCSSIVLDKSERSTIVDEWQLVCDRNLYRANTFFVFAFGRLLGFGILGMYADKYGRKKSLIIGLILQIIVVPSSAVTPWFSGYIFLKLITGIGVGALYSSGYTILSEVANDSRRKILGVFTDVMYPVGTCIVVTLAYFITNWRYLQMTLAVFTIPLMILIWIMPESPQWLISQNRHDKAQKVIQKYCKDIIAPTLVPENLTRESIPTESTKNSQYKILIHRYFESMRILFTNPSLRKNIIIMYFSFFVSISVGYSLIFSVDTFNINRYIYMATAASSEILALMTVPVILIFLSCQNATVVIYVTASICMFSIVVIPRDEIYIVLGLTMLSKFCLTACFTTIMLLSSELFPPSVRNSSLGTSLLMGQVGCMTAPYIVDLLGKIAWWAPNTLCGTLTLIAGLLILVISKKELNNNDSNSNSEEEMKI